MNKEVYRHFKGEEYVLLHFAEHTETGEELVVYAKRSEAMSAGGRSFPSIWVRPAAMFFDMVMHEGQRVERFARTGRSVDCLF